MTEARGQSLSFNDKVSYTATLKLDRRLMVTALPFLPSGRLLPAERLKKQRIGEVLVEQGTISEKQLQLALDLQKQSGKKIGRVLVESGAVTDEVLADAIARQLNIRFIDLKTFPFRTDLLRLLPEAASRRFRALILEEIGNTLLVAMGDPTDLFAFDELTRLLKRPITIAAVPDGQLTLSLDRLYRRTEEISGFARELEKDVGGFVDFGELTASAGVQGAPVVRLLQSIFEDAIQIGASDVHIEPQETVLQIRLRVDGVLQTQTLADNRIGGPLAQRLKLMAGLDIAEKRLPQDGRFSIRIKDHSIDVRLSTLLTTHGEAAVMRLLDQSEGMRRLDSIGMPARMLKRFREVLKRSAGLVLVTGPTGSGKTTTLYAALTELNVSELKVITVEDPVEYRLPGITQVQVNEKIDFSFSRVLRATLRQDPDVILIGEMRDQETAEIGLRSAITGHLVLSTLHTRDAMSTPFRLLDMGVPPFMVATSLQAVIAQRLVRLNCPECATFQAPTAQEMSWLAAMGEADKPMLFKRGRGCLTCHGTGYSGRQGVYELLDMNIELTHAVLHSDPAAFMKAARSSMKGTTLAHHALELVRDGRTTLAEAIRVGFDMDEEDKS